MVNKYEKHHEVTEFEIGDYCTIQVSKKDRPPQQCLSHPYTPPGPPTLRLPLHVPDEARHLMLEVYSQKPKPNRSSYCGGQRSRDW